MSIAAVTVPTLIASSPADHADLSDARAQSPRSFVFGEFVLIPERQSLHQGGTPVRIGGRALDLLTALVERPGELLNKHELMSRAWPSTFVEETNLKVNIASLRRILGESRGTPRYIATVSGRGYRFIAPVRPLAEEEALALLRAEPSQIEKVLETLDGICRLLLQLKVATALTRGDQPSVQ